MNPIFPLKRCILFTLVLMSQVMFAQLNDFNFSVSTTDETCAGNGSISMSVSGTTTNATLSYLLFLFPDIDTPIAQTSANSFSNLDSGNYRVQAIQTLGDLQNSQSTDATVENITSALNFEVAQVFLGDCENASLVVTTISGNAELYEIISGPVTVGLQTDNTFNNLPQGTYIVRVFDDCNNALTKTFTLLLSNTTFSIETSTQPNPENSCEETMLTTIITAGTGTNLVYPIIIDFTISLLDGSGSINFSNTYNSGPEMQFEFAEFIANYDVDIFQIEIVAQDQCGNSISNIEVVNPNPVVELTPTAGLCGSNMDISVNNVTPPYTLEFTEAPIEFDFSDYSDNEDGIYTTSLISLGTDATSLPYGTYSVRVVDSCNRIGIATIDLVEELVEPFITPTNEGCNSLLGALTVSIPDREIVSAIFTSVPEAYENPIPDDLFNFITDDGALIIEELPKGNYTLEMIDDCGNVYVEDILIPELIQLPLNVVTSPNCTTETGTLRIAGSYGQIESVFITQAPATFSASLPFDYGSAISSNGVFFVGNLPVGNYTVEFTDTCGNEYMTNQNIESYSSDSSIFALQRNCGSFNLSIFDNDASVENQSYWLQKYFSENNDWGNPNTGVIYNEGDLPNATNSMAIQNGETVFNLFVVGTFRLIKAFQTINNPNPEEYCLDIFGEFEVGSDLIINDVFNLNCEGASGPSDVLVDVIGVPPYNFSIVSPFIIDNGENNIFTNLNPGVYEIKVEDVCGSIETITVNLLDLLPVVSIGNATDLVVCREDLSSSTVFDLSQQNSQLLGNQNPENLTITYHLNQSDADSGENPIPETYETNSNAQTIYARIIHNTLDICYQTGSFQLIVGAIPSVGPDESITICNNSSILLAADLGYSNYLWSTGENSRVISVNTSGQYSVTVSNDYGDFYCEATKTFTINVSGTALINNIETEDFTANNNSINVQVSGLGDYEFSLDGLIYQDESYFADLPSGDYMIFVRDKNGCGISTQDFSLLNYRRFFTPNGDGDNEYWQVSGSQFEPDLQVYIYNRFGKLLTGFTGSNLGWDGTYNGQNMPSSDYWFVIERSNGTIYTGHFTLKR